MFSATSVTGYYFRKGQNFHVRLSCFHEHAYYILRAVANAEKLCHFRIVKCRRFIRPQGKFSHVHRLESLVIWRHQRFSQHKMKGTMKLAVRRSLANHEGFSFSQRLFPVCLLRIASSVLLAEGMTG